MPFNLDKGSAEKKKINLSKAETTTAADDAVPTEITTKHSGNKTKLWIVLLLTAIVVTMWIALSNRPGESEKVTANEQSATNTVYPASAAVAREQNQTAGTAKPGNDTKNVASDKPSPAQQNSPVVDQSDALDSQGSTMGEQPAKRPPTLAGFAPGSSKLVQVNENIAGIIARLKKDPGLKVSINGYASSEGTLNANIALSNQRANSLKRFFLKQGISASQIEVEGHGIDNPIASNETESGRSQNRRVEVIVLQ